MFSLMCRIQNFFKGVKAVDGLLEKRKEPAGEGEGATKGSGRKG
jgi:hypothetical protein